jgi:hypothetical protein
MEKKLTWAAFVGVVLLAAFFRFYAMNQVPPGPHYDETIDARLAKASRFWAMTFHRKLAPGGELTILTR